MPLIRLWLIEHSLSPAEEQRVRELRSAGRDGNRGPDKITYRKKRVVKDVDSESAAQAASLTMMECEAMPDLEGVLRKFTTVFAAAPAEDGEKCLQIENAWQAEDQDLPFPT